MRLKKFFIALSAVAILLGVFGIETAAAVQKKITVTSSAFANNKEIPVKYVHFDVPGGENRSLPIAWKVKKKIVSKIKSFAVSMIDLHPIAEKCVHLFVVNIPADARALEDGALSGFASVPMGTQQLLNCFNELGYLGPDPPAGSGSHNYEITVYGLKVAEVVSMDAAMRYYSADEIKALLKGKIVAKGKLKGKFEVR